MSEELKTLLKWDIDTVVIKRFKFYDRLGGTSFTLDDGTWVLWDSAGVSVLNGSYTKNNADTDAAGNAIKTITITVELNSTDVPALGVYYLTIDVALTSGQSDRFRYPVEIVDHRLKGVTS